MPDIIPPPEVDYVELGITTNFSFLRGASQPAELVLTAAYCGYRGIGIADRNSLAGVVRALSAFDHEEFPTPRPELLIGARLVFADGTPDILVYPENRDAYGGLCRLLTKGKTGLGVKKGECILTLDDLLVERAGLLLILMPPRRPDAATGDLLRRLADASRGRVWLGAAMLHQGDDRRRLARLADMANAAGVPLIATNDVLHHAPERRQLQDVLTCIREKTTIDKAGRLLQANAERHLKQPVEMARLFRDRPEAIAETMRFMRRIDFRLDELTYEYPEEPVPPGKTPQRHLEDLAWAGARKRYRGTIPTLVRRTLHKELRLIRALDYPRYFLTVHDIVRQARKFGILCQGRGSAANSVVCYVLGVTAVNPIETSLLFARFLSKERKEPPDIDVDFEHERREELIQWIYKRYGRDRAALTATVISYRPRSAIRDVGKALGLTEDVTAALAGTVWGSWGDEISRAQVRQAGLDPDNPSLRRAVRLATELLGFPRHLSQHVGGFVLTKRRLDETVPIGNAAMDDRTFIEWDKDDIDRMKMMKVDVLALGMLTCIRKAFELLDMHGGLKLDLDNVGRGDPAVYEMLQRGDSLGVFQVESRAQINMLPRLKPKNFYDLVIEVAIVRPGPIQGNMVHPYLKRRAGLEEAILPTPSREHGPPDELEKILRRTLGVPLFQEQAMQLAIDAAKFTPDEANGLRRAMATFRNVGTMENYREKMISKMVARGYEPDFATRCWNQIKGFGSYGFPESHAASFARLVYVSSWIKCHHPAAFACALLNAQPMGFYAPAEIVRDAREHGVEVRPADVGFSEHDNTLERRSDGTLALRLGLRQIDGFSKDWTDRVMPAWQQHAFADIDDFARRTRLPKRALVILADADAFRSLGPDRRTALWAVRRLPDDMPLPLFSWQDQPDLAEERLAPLPDMALSEEVVADYQTARLSLKGHPMQFLRGLFSREGVLSCAEVAASVDGRRASCAGIVLVRQRPGEGKVVFVTLADETGITNVVIWASMMERYRKEVMGARILKIEGRIQKSPEGIVHLVAEHMTDRSHEMERLSDTGRVPLRPSDIGGDTEGDFHADLHVPESHHSQARPRHPRNVRVLPPSRDFH